MNRGAVGVAGRYTRGGGGFSFRDSIVADQRLDEVVSLSAKPREERLARADLAAKRVKAKQTCIGIVALVRLVSPRRL